MAQNDKLTGKTVMDRARGTFLAFLRGLRLDGGTTDRRGRLELTIKVGQTLDLGEIRVRAASLETGR